MAKGLAGNPCLSFFWLYVFFVTHKFTYPNFVPYFSVKYKMKSILKNRLALSTVVTTLIILVVSVLLAGVVTYFAINVTSTRVQEESLQLTKLHVWYDSGSEYRSRRIYDN